MCTACAALRFWSPDFLHAEAAPVFAPDAETTSADPEPAPDLPWL